MMGSTTRAGANARTRNARQKIAASRGAANVITAAICTLTHGQPGSVCQSSGVKAAAGSR